MINKFNKQKSRQRRRHRIRNKIHGTPVRPRLSVYKSNNNMYAQVIDDVNGVTLASASTLEENVKSSLESTSNKEAARKVGEMVGERALEKGIKEVVFDRSGYIYHGKIQELADGAREAGLKF